MDCIKSIRKASKMNYTVIILLAAIVGAQALSFERFKNATSSRRQTTTRAPTIISSSRQEIAARVDPSSQDGPGSQRITDRMREIFGAIDEQDSRQGNAAMSKLCESLFGSCDPTRVSKIVDIARGIVKNRGHVCGPSTRGSQDCLEEARALAELMGQGQPATEPSDSESGSEEVSIDETCESSEDENYCPRRNTSLNTMAVIVRLADRNQTEKSIQAKYSWYRRQYLPAFRAAVANGGTLRQKLEDIDESTYVLFQQARQNHLPVRGWTIRDWAAERAIEINLTEFKAGPIWSEDSKRRHRIRSRKVTKTLTRPQGTVKK